jgi:hypothetical protein
MRFAKLLLALLRELAGENAYQRHLAFHGRIHSPEEWRAFTKDYLSTKYSKPKCC